MGRYLSPDDFEVDPWKDAESVRMDDIKVGIPLSGQMDNMLASHTFNLGSILDWGDTINLPPLKR